MLFNASAILENRHGKPFREPKDGEKPKLDPKTGQPTGFDDTQMRDIRHGDIALVALDSALEGDDKLMKDDPTKWVKAVMKREDISRAIAAAMKDGDGWATLKNEQKETLLDRLALCAPRLGLAMTGPVMAVLEAPPEAKPAPDHAGKPNGTASEQPAAAA